MCGIVGYVGQRPVVDVLLKGLKRLEYRGYDSTGIAYFDHEKIDILKSQGKLEAVEKMAATRSNTTAGLGGSLAGRFCGIGHTRWATHGRPTTQNAHPHRTGHVVLVHNGIIENYQEIRDELVARGHAPQSETDSELFGFLVLEEMDSGRDLTESVRRSFKKLHGSCSVVVMSEREPGLIVGVRNGTPLVAALEGPGGSTGGADGAAGAFLASDAQPLLEYTKDVVFLENGDVALCRPGELRIVGLDDGRTITRSSTRLDWSADRMEKQGYPHFMLKEIHEQPVALVDTLNALLDRASGVPFYLAPQPGIRLLDEAKEILLLACGTSFHAALLAKYWLESVGGVATQVELASEFRYRDSILRPGTLVVGISQSGETADTLAVIREMRSRGVPTLALTNVRGSTMAREADAVFFTSAGPEIGVAATKTFTCQLLVLLLWAGYLSQSRAPSRAQSQAQTGARASGVNAIGRSPEALFAEVLKLPHALKDWLEPTGEASAAISAAAQALFDTRGFFFIGRGTSYPIALEGALKLKEIAYVHAEGYAAGELKHGPIAMIDPSMAVVALAPQDGWREKTISNLEEVRARGARIVAIGTHGDHALRRITDHWIPIPEGELTPFFLAGAMQRLSYELAVLKGTDVDQPRNLAKSVTVE